MAVVSSKLIFQNILKSYCSLKCILPVLRTSSQFSTLPANYDDNRKISGGKMSRAMKAYLDRAKEHGKSKKVQVQVQELKEIVQYVKIPKEEFIKQQLEEFNIGKKHLANMMGKKVEEMTQANIDEAISYLLPSGLFVPKARPLMKPPEEVFAKQKAVEFDYSGRPFHFLFYTTKPNFSKLLHDAAKQLETLIQYEQKMKEAGDTTPPQSLTLAGTNWLSQEGLQQKLLEKIFKLDYDKFVEVFERIASHPYSYLAEEFIKQYRTQLPEGFSKEKSTIFYCEDGSVCSRVDRAKRKTAMANVEVKYPGTGKIKINNIGIDYFSNMDSRKQVMMILMYGGSEIKCLNC